MVTAVNGEIYNYNQIRQRLTGHRHQSSCDVEVVSHLCEDFWLETPAMLRGQFAFAAWRQEDGRLLLARDRLGTCPLYIAQWEDCLVFASEIKSLLTLPGFRTAIDLGGLDHVLHLPGLVSPQTMFEGIWSMPPGHALEIAGSRQTLYKYWDMDYGAEDSFTDDDISPSLVVQVRDEIDRAVTDRLMGESPVGVYLSGGLDSSIIASLAHARGGLAHTFAVEFDDAFYDESSAQEVVRAQLDGVSHHRVRLDAAAVFEDLAAAVRHAETPLRESYHSASIALARAAQSEGVKVILSGEGADELFGGYASYRWDRAYDGGSGGSVRRPLASMFELEMRERVWGDTEFAYEQGFESVRQLKRAVLTDDAREAMRDQGIGARRLLDPDQLRGRHQFHRRSYADLKLRLGDHLLTGHGDRLSMAHSVEGRFPFTDERILDLMRRTRAGVHLDRVDKPLLRAATVGLVPPSISSRPKQGFASAGSDDLFRQSPDFRDALDLSRIADQNIFKVEAIARYLDDYSDPSYSLAVPIETDVVLLAVTLLMLEDLLLRSDRLPEGRGGHWRDAFLVLPAVGEVAGQASL